MAKCNQLTPLPFKRLILTRLPYSQRRITHNQDAIFCFRDLDLMSLVYKLDPDILNAYQK